MVVSYLLTVNVRDLRARFALVLREAEGAPLCTHRGEGVDQRTTQ